MTSSTPRRWPALPADDAPPLEWARFYRDRLGWIVLPTRCAADMEELAEWTARRYLADEATAGRVVDDEARARIIGEAKEEAARTKRAPMVRFRERSAVSDDEIDAWWGAGSKGRGEQRGIWVAMGRLSDAPPATQGGERRWGALVCAVDVDPRAGGDEGPWADNGGPLARTPGGGVHALHLWQSSIPCATSPHGPAIGVDVRAGGGGIVVPSGPSSPGRRWERWEEPGFAPRGLTEWADGRGTTALRERASAVATGPRNPGGKATSNLAEALTQSAGDGSRNGTAAIIVGMLARQKAIPEDALEPALALLAEDGVGAKALEHWRLILTRGPRTEEHAIAFLSAWNAQRADPSWPWRRAERTARSLWKTAAMREPDAGGVDGHHLAAAWSTAYAGPPQDDAPMIRRALPAPPLSAAPMIDVDARPSAAAITSPLTPPPASQPFEVITALPHEQVIRRMEPQPIAIPPGFCVDLSEAFPTSRFREDRLVTPISIDVLPTWLQFDDREDHTAPYGYGVGPWLNESLGGGFRRGSFVSLGALTAKAGKTTFLQQIADGLVLLSAQRLIAHRNGAAGEDQIFLIHWLTEMETHADLSYRMIGRYLGIDTSFWGRGTAAHTTPGIQSLALSFDIDPRVIAVACDKRVERWLDDPHSLLSVARSLCVNMDPAMIPRGKKKKFSADPRRGNELLDLTARAIEERVQRFAERERIEPRRIVPIVVLDPVQRFIDPGDGDRLGALNEMIHGARELAHVKRWLVFATSDTTKGGADTDKDLTGDPAALAAKAFGGSINLAHEPDTVVVLHAEQVDPPLSGPRIVNVPVSVRVCLCRRASAGPPVPFMWKPHLGRYTAIDPADAPRKGESKTAQIEPPKMETYKRRGRPKKL